MSYRTEKQENGGVDLVIDGFENGIAMSPHEGIANMQGVNIATESGEVMCSYNRVKQSQTSGSGTLTQVNTNTVSVSGITLLVGTWIHITNGGTTGLSGDYYYVSSGKLSATFAQNASTIVTGITSGSATFTVYAMGSPVMSATEPYRDASNVKQYRYYILDDLAQLWVHDTSTLSGVDTPLWFSAYKPFSLSGKTVSGLAVLNGFVCITEDSILYWKSTSTLGEDWISTGQPNRMGVGFHNTLVGNQGKLYITDGNYIASVFPNTSLLTGSANIQSYATWTASTTTGTITNLISGSYPVAFDSAGTATRVPAIFFTTGTKPTNLTAGTLSPLGINFVYTAVYYIEYMSLNTFSVYSALTGGVAINIQTGYVGTQYFNTFFPFGVEGRSMMTVTPQRVNLPYYESAQCLAELGNTVIIGGKSNNLYPWDQVSALPGDIIPLPENDVKKLVTVNNALYVFAGNKGNIYISNGSSTAHSLSVPDYCAGIAGTPASYIEPVFTWGDAMYMRGRVYFSILDQTSTKAGNCGGVWSFVPTQNFFVGQNTGQALRLENQNSYGTYNGVATVLLKNQDQSSIGPQYWSGWYSSISGPTYGIDYSDTVTTPSAVIETDLIPTGTLLGKKTFSQIEYKLSSPLASGETVAIKYRQNATDAFTTCGTAKTESATALSGYFSSAFQNGQWLQLQITLNPLATSSSSFVRLTEVRIR